MLAAFEAWTQGRQVQTLGTNAGADKLPFQTWRHFKEAFAPELVARAITESGRKVNRCIDPFGGSGTTALACQFIGAEPSTIEINPYLADLIEAKLSSYHGSNLAKDFGYVLRSAKSRKKSHDLSHLPPTFVYPGVKGRWIFPLEVANRIESYRLSIEALSDDRHKKLFKALLGGIVIEVSNVYVNGKGRRYRENWINREKQAKDVDELFCEKAQLALCEIVRYSRKPQGNFNLLRGDSRALISKLPSSDLAIFSPPYPNSFDYTDIYNVELWMLGYLKTSEDNKSLRQSTLSSHVSILREYASKPSGSRTLNGLSKELHQVGPDLWNRWIPHMVDAYFSDMKGILEKLKQNLRIRGEVWMVVGDSLYGNIHVPVAKILKELSTDLGYEVKNSEAFRSMRSSAQQGGQHQLDETLIVLKKR